MLIPIAVIFVFSFNNPSGRYNFTWVGFTLDHWKNVFGIPELNEALWTSINWRCWRRWSRPCSAR